MLSNVTFGIALHFLVKVRSIFSTVECDMQLLFLDLQLATLITSNWLALMNCKLKQIAVYNTQGN